MTAIPIEQLQGWVRRSLATTPARWSQLATLPLELLAASPAPGEWSALDCLRHLIETEKYVFPVRLEAFATGADIPRFDPAGQPPAADPDASPVTLAGDFAELRRENIVRLGKLKLPDLDRTARHQDYGDVTLVQLLHHWAAHDLNHTVQAERALMQPFIAGAGPWQANFTDHLISG